MEEDVVAGEERGAAAEDVVAEVFATQIWVIGADHPEDDHPEDDQARDGQARDDQARDGQVEDDQAQDDQVEDDQARDGHLEDDQAVDGQAMGEAVGTADIDTHDATITDFARLTICSSLVRTCSLDLAIRQQLLSQGRHITTLMESTTCNRAVDMWWFHRRPELSFMRYRQPLQLSMWVQNHITTSAEPTMKQRLILLRSRWLAMKVAKRKNRWT